ncbi:MAG TPA: hypothetical protein VHP63_07310 [candidate division Zixibacteria bacterium]|nr:hypothetical protein [candidate division Zixibacteria bacterium]
MKRLLISFSLIALLYLLILGCSDDEPTAPTQPARANVLILDDVGTQDSLLKILDSANFDVTLGGPFWAYTGTNFSAYDLVIILHGVSYSEYIADSIQAALRNYVNGGGVLLTTEWLLYYNENTYDSILHSIIPVSYNDNYEYFPETYLKVTDHAITAGVPDSFDTRTDWTLVYMIDNATSLSTNHQVIYNGKNGGPAITIGTYGAGRSIHWAMAGQYRGADIWSPEVRRIFINIAAFSKTI